MTKNLLMDGYIYMFIMFLLTNNNVKLSKYIYCVYPFIWNTSAVSTGKYRSAKPIFFLISWLKKLKPGSNINLAGNES